MKTLTALAFHFATQAAYAADLTIHVDDVKSADGRLMVALYSSQDAFLRKPSKFAAVPAVKGSATIVVRDLPPGDLAFALFHDANGNEKMDKNAMGIPTEDHAFSNNALGQMGPPSFNSARIALPAAGASVRVSLR